MTKYSYEELKNISRKEISELLKNSSHLSDMEWKIISTNSNFHPDMVDEFYLSLLSWESLSAFKQLSIEEIEKYKNYVDWYSISCFQRLTIDFIVKYKDKLSLDKLKSNQNLLKDVQDFAANYYKKFDDPEHHKIWDDNLRNSTIFCPKNFKGRYSDYKIPKKKKQKAKKLDYSKMKKAEMKEILIKRGVRVYYHDTLEILINKCKNSEPKEG